MPSKAPSISETMILCVFSTVVSRGPLCDPFVYRVKVQGHTGVLLFLPLHLQVRPHTCVLSTPPPKGFTVFVLSYMKVINEITNPQIPWQMPVLSDRACENSLNQACPLQKRFPT